VRWILNPDAELEFQRPEGYQPRAAVILAMQSHLPRFAWLTQSDPASFVMDVPKADVDRRALLWSPSPSAQEAASRAGYEFPKAPSLTVLRAANAKENLVEFGLPAPRIRDFVRSRPEFESTRARLEPDEKLRAKRRFAFAGRAQRRVGAHLTESDERYVEEALRHGGLLLESEQKVTREWSIHGVVWGGFRSFGGDSETAISLGSACAVETNAHGSVVGLKRATGGQPALRELGENAARKLAELGYFGPFGLDFLEGDHGLVASDLNARFTLGWSIGMGPDRGAALERMFA
jgi:hypothetical protein